MPYQENILPLTKEEVSNGVLAQMWEISQGLLEKVFGTDRLWELTGNKDLPTICYFARRPLTGFDVESLRSDSELAFFMEALDHVGYFGPSAMTTIELSTRITGPCQMMDVVFHRVRGLTDGDVGLSLVHDDTLQHFFQQISFVQGCGVEDSATMRAGRELEVSLRGADRGAALPFPRLIEIFSHSQEFCTIRE